MLITQHAVFAYLGDAFWPLMRMTGVFLTAPIFGNSAVPVPFRVLLATLISACLAAWGGPWPPLPPTTAGVFFSGAVGIAFGASIGLVGRIVVAAVASAGELASLALGVSFATASGLSSETTAPILYDVLEWAGLLVYLGIGGPFVVMQAISHSFHTIPAGIPAAVSLRDLAVYGGVIIRASLILALPAIAASLAMNAVIGLANALAPQLNIFSIGFPLLFLGGIWILAVSLFFVEPIAARLLHEGATVMAALAHG